MSEGIRRRGPGNPSNGAPVSPSKSTPSASHPTNPSSRSATPLVVQQKRRRKYNLWVVLFELAVLAAIGWFINTLRREKGDGQISSETTGGTENIGSRRKASPRLSHFPPDVDISSLQWKQHGQNINGDYRDSSGKDVAISWDGTIVAIGSPHSTREEYGSDSGHVRVFKWEDAQQTWMQLGQTIETYGAYHQRGFSVGLSSNGMILAFGAPCLWESYRSGYVKVFELKEKIERALGDDETHIWAQRGRTIDTYESSDNWGWSLSLSADGNVIATGAPWSKNNGLQNSGQVRVFEWNESNSDYKLRGKEIRGEAAKADLAGSSVALSADGNTMAIGSPGKDDKMGCAKVYQWDHKARRYKQLGKAIMGKEAGDSLGFSLALSSDGYTLAVGAPGGDMTYGYVGVYAWNEATLNYDQMGHDIDGSEVGDRTGQAVAISSDGYTLAVGSPWHRAKSGRVILYGWADDVMSYNQQVGGAIDGANAADYFGRAVALSSNGKMLSIGAPHNSENWLDSGQVQVYYIEY